MARRWKCASCGYEWEARVSKPKQCPRCKRYLWKGAGRRV